MGSLAVGIAKICVTTDLTVSLEPRLGRNPALSNFKIGMCPVAALRWAATTNALSLYLLLKSQIHLMLR